MFPPGLRVKGKEVRGSRPRMEPPKKEAAQSLKLATRSHTELNWAWRRGAWGHTLLQITVLCSLWP